MPETTAMVSVCLHYWAGAKAAAGVERETVEAATVAEAMAAAARRHGDPRFARILNVSSVLMENRVLRGDDLRQVLAASVEVDVLPPFAGG
jgi:sulfur-carrier protein